MSGYTRLFSSQPPGLSRLHCPQRLAALALLLCALLTLELPVPVRAGEAVAPPLPPGLVCGDFLTMAGKKPGVLEFLGCEPDRDAQVRVLAARYRVRGADAALVEDALRRESGMHPLVFVCCRWEMEKNGQGRFGFRQPGLSRASAQADGGLLGTYRVRMGSGDTEYYERSEWLLIPWFYVTVLLDLEMP